jgi:NAD(P)-dependent dehydrogenase (short-subunit alcohol dehydrogenase family)
MKLSSAKAIVTAGAAGIGRGIAELLVRKGAQVVIADIDTQTGKQTASEIGATFIQVDVTRDEDLKRLLDEAEHVLGTINVFVNNAGGVEGESYPLAPVNRWATVLELNLRSVMVATQLALERIETGVVVAIASVAALGDEPHAAPEYAAAKAGVVRFITALRTHDGVRLVCVCPDSTRTPAMIRTLASKPPGFDPGPMLEPSDVAAAVVQLIRDETACGRVLLVRAGEPIRVIAR